MKMMKKTVKATLALILLCSAVFAQSLGDAKKAIDAEQYLKAKDILKNLIKSKPADAENYFYLGNVYLKNDYVDSAKATFAKGVAADAEYPLNYVGLGAVDLENNNKAAAKANFEKAQSLVKKKDDTPALYTGKAYTFAKDYDAALNYLENPNNPKAAKLINPKDAEVFIAIGDAYRDRNNTATNDLSSAYKNYQDALVLDNTLIRAKLELAIIAKRAFAWSDAVSGFNEIIKANPNYAPVYRELAETYRNWAYADPKDFDAHMQLALQSYEKYMTLTDQSLESRIRHADFLVYAKQWKQLQQEAAEMAKVPGANEKILRYLGFSAFWNKDYPSAEKAFDQWITKADPKRLITEDYLYRGQAKVSVGIGPPIDNAKILQGLDDLKKAVALDSTNADAVEEVAKSIFAAKIYDVAGDAYQIATKNPSNAKKVFDYYYVGYSNYLHFAIKYGADTTATRDQGKPYLVKADTAFSYVIKASPATYDAYFYRAKIAKYIDDQKNPTGLFIPAWEKYISIITTKTDPLTVSEKAKLIEGYNALGTFYLPKKEFISDATVTPELKLAAITKAEEYFNKTIAIDANNAYAKAVLEGLGSYKIYVTTPAPTPGTKPAAPGTVAPAK